MAALRDWTKTLWAASYKGFPFYFERDEEEGGLGIVIHKFPNSDVPFNEDLGEDPRFFSGSAYLFGDDADTQTANFVATLVSHGPGPLVVPIYGPINCRCLTFKRVSEKDKLGYIAFDVRFVREGAATALISVPYLSQVAYDAATALGVAIAATAPALFTIAEQPEFVAAAAAAEIQAAIAVVDAVRTSYPVTAAVSETVAGYEQAITLAAPLLLDPDGPQTSDVANLAAAVGLPAPTTTETTMPVNAGIRILTTAVVTTLTTLASGMTPAVAQDAMASIVDVYAAPTAAAQASIAAALSANATTAAGNVTGAQQLVRLAALTAWVNAVIGGTYTDRPQGVTARAEAAERFEIELNNCPGQLFAALYVTIEALQGSVVQFLTQLIANLAPVITVDANTAMPSLVWAWKLYQDPTRSVDLTLRNSITHPSFFPLEFVALAPGYNAPGIPTAWPAPPL
jgi:prophage DNA circulation protein